MTKNKLASVQCAHNAHKHTHIFYLSIYLSINSLVVGDVSGGDGGTRASLTRTKD